MYKTLILAIMLIHSMALHAEPVNKALHGARHAVARTAVKHTPRLHSAIALVYDAQNKHALYKKHADEVVPIASISKLMTAMVILDAQLSLKQRIRIDSDDVDRIKWSRSRVRPGIILTRGELLKLALMSSENRAAAALARTYPGGTEVVVAKMNAKARALGMKDTHFVEPTGLDSGNVSTAHDLVKLVLATQSYGVIRRATTSTSHVVTRPGSRPLMFVNTNPLVRSSSWDIRVSKTGYISEAGECLVMKANIKQHPVVIVLLDSWGKNSRIVDAIRIRRWMERV